jgi:hypothetical protein
MQAVIASSKGIPGGADPVLSSCGARGSSWRTTALGCVASAPPCHSAAPGPAWSTIGGGRRGLDLPGKGEVVAVSAGWSRNSRSGSAVGRFRLRRGRPDAQHYDHLHPERLGQPLGRESGSAEQRPQLPPAGSAGRAALVGAARPRGSGSVRAASGRGEWNGRRPSVRTRPFSSVRLWPGAGSGRREAPGLDLVREYPRRRRERQPGGAVGGAGERAGG